MHFRYRMESRSLRYFSEVVRLASISRAAEKLHVSQPGISRCVRQLEEQLGVKLLMRTATGVFPTDAGRILYSRAQSITLEINRAEAELSEFSIHRNTTVCVGVLRSQMWGFMPSVAAKILAVRPDIKLKVVEQSRSSLLNGLVRGEFDLVISVVRAEEAPSNVAHSPLFRDRPCVIMRPGHPAAKNISRLVNYPWIVPPSGSERRVEFDNILRSFNIDRQPETLIECDSHIFLRAMVSKSDCIGVMPYEPSAAEMNECAIAVLPSCLPHTRAVALLTRNDYPLSAKANYVAGTIRSVAETYV